MYFNSTIFNPPPQQHRFINQTMHGDVYTFRGFRARVLWLGLGFSAGEMKYSLGFRIMGG